MQKNDTKASCHNCYWMRSVYANQEKTIEEKICCHDITPLPCFVRDYNQCSYYEENLNLITDITKKGNTNEN